jgi:DNA polymerase-3 subunit beta
MSAINQASLVLSADSKGIDFHFDEGELKLTGTGQDVGGSEVELPVAWDSKALSITFDGKLIVDFLKPLDAADPVELLLNGENDAGVFFAGNGYRYVVMPLAK